MVGGHIYRNTTAIASRELIVKDVWINDDTVCNEIATDD